MGNPAFPWAWSPVTRPSHGCGRRVQARRPKAAIRQRIGSRASASRVRDRHRRPFPRSRPAGRCHRRPVRPGASLRPGLQFRSGAGLPLGLPLRPGARLPLGLPLRPGPGLPPEQRRPRQQRQSAPWSPHDLSWPSRQQARRWPGRSGRAGPRSSNTCSNAREAGECPPGKRAHPPGAHAGPPPAPAEPR
jgi:hypothetical protein